MPFHYLYNMVYKTPKIDSMAFVEIVGIQHFTITITHFNLNFY